MPPSGDIFFAQLCFVKYFRHIFKMCTDTELFIPANNDGIPVTAIGSNAFFDCVNLTKVVIPDSITSIAGGAFKGCSSLEEITLPFVGASVPVHKDACQIRAHKRDLPHLSSW